MNSLDVSPIVDEYSKKGFLRNIVNAFSLSSEIDALEQRELRKDFEQEVALILLEYRNPDKLIRMYARDETELMNFIFMIARNNIMSGKSLFYRKYIRALRLRDWNYPSNRLEQMPNED